MGFIADTTKTNGEQEYRLYVSLNCEECIAAIRGAMNALTAAKQFGWTFKVVDSTGAVLYTNEI